MIAAAAVGPSAYWYMTRGTGTVALVLLTLSVALGVANVRRVRTERVPRFVFDAVHRSVSLLALAFTGVHIVTSVLDGFAPVRLVDAVVPFAGSYRALWLGLGAVAFDLLLAVVITSVLRARFGYRAWRVTHWAAYASWPTALLHGVGTGSDTKVGWMLVIVAACVIVVSVAVVARAIAGWPDRIVVRVPAIAAAALVPLGLLVWLPSGPLAAGWARRAGTPASLLASTSAGPPAKRSAHVGGRSGSAASGPASSGAAPTAGAPTSFTTQATGTVRQGEASNGLAVVDISLALEGQRLSALRIRIVGEPIQAGGVQMTSSRVTLGTASTPDRYRGRVIALQGTNVEAEVRGAGGATVRLLAELQLDQGSGGVTGTVAASPTGGG
jgi:Ferric reductase like transmembrane component